MFFSCGDLFSKKCEIIASPSLFVSKKTWIDLVFFFLVFLLMGAVVKLNFVSKCPQALCQRVPNANQNDLAWPGKWKVLTCKQIPCKVSYL